MVKVHEEEWSFIPVGGPLPVPGQNIAAFGAAANLVHPATGGANRMCLSEIQLHSCNPKHSRLPCLPCIANCAIMMSELCSVVAELFASSCCVFAAAEASYGHDASSVQART